MKTSPKISVIMPAYNAERYISEAIESILNQSFKDFEFIIINDGSSDKSPRVIAKYANKDKRIRVISHENKGYAVALNEGIAIAKGDFVARMDADDISLPERLKKEFDYLEKHPKCAVIASVVQPIDEKGNLLDFWAPDAETIAYEDINNRLPIENCVAHPSVMIRSDIMKKYGYNASQVPSEDYDLWLRLIADSHQIHKLADPLLLYRIHGTSVTQSFNQRVSINRKMLRVKSRFLKGQLTRVRFGPIEKRVFISFSKLLLYLIFRKSENILWKIFISPIKTHAHRLDSFLRRFHRMLYLTHLLANRLFLYKELSLTRRDNIGPSILFIVPWFGIGGAEKVVLDIITGLNKRGYRISCISTVESNNDWIELYAKHCTEVIDLDSIAMESNKAWFLNKYALKNGVATAAITNNYPGYRAAALMKASNPHIKIFDIVHGQGGKEEGGGWPLFSTPFDKFIDKRVVVTEYLKKYLVQKHDISSEKIVVIHNGVARPSAKPPLPAPEIKTQKDKFIVLWAGRFSYEKHPELAIETAKLVSLKNSKIHFILVGKGELKDSLIQKVEDYGLQRFVTIAKQPYTNPRTYMDYSDVLLVSSEMEGLPMVILEAFASRLPVITSKVGGIPEMVDDGKSGYLIEYSSTYPEIAADIITRLSKNEVLKKNLGQAGYSLSMTKFSMDEMVDSYIKILSSDESR